MTIAEVITIGIAFIALIVSIYSVALQYSAEGAKIELLNGDDKQIRTARPHKELPEHIQKGYPDIPDALPGYALVKLVFGNSGDRTGIASIKDLKVTIKNNPDLLGKASYFNYALIPAYDIVEKEILLRNIELGVSLEHPLEIELKIEYGGYHPRTGKYLHKETIEKTLQVSIVRADENPWLIS
jgi:hypothetical protein